VSKSEKKVKKHVGPAKMSEMRRYVEAFCGGGPSMSLCVEVRVREGPPGKGWAMVVVLKNGWHSIVMMAVVSEP
jgi:hypothetical protein